MKKLIALVLAMVCVLGLVGCNNRSMNYIISNEPSITGIVKETNEDAILIATETNLRQRSFDDLSPSEKAYCLKQHYDAIKSQGRRNDLIKEIEELVNPHETGKNGTSVENPKKSDAGAAVSEEYGLSKDRIARYLRIATLITPLLDCLDAKTLGFEAACDCGIDCE